MSVHSSPAKSVGNAPLVLLFYDGYELKARRRLVPRLFHRVRCAARALWRFARGKQVNTGFYVAFKALVEGLSHLGCKVRINDFAAARADPSYPIGIGGYPSVLTEVDLPNPVIFGPGDPGYPDTAGLWANQPKVKAIIQPSDWFVSYYAPYCRDKMLCCPVGINLAALEDASKSTKDIDVLIYDKIRWNRHRLVPAVRDRLIAKLTTEGLSYRVLEYGKHTTKTYFSTLRRSRSMAFLCEHETQGLACEEAMAMNIPILAWEETKLADPRQLPFAQSDLKVSSVPYFDARCGVTFTVVDMEDKVDAFWRCLSAFKPRQYIAERLTPSITAQIFLDQYVKMLAC